MFIGDKRRCVDGPRRIRVPLLSQRCADSGSGRSPEILSNIRERFSDAKERFTDFYEGARKKVVAGARYTDTTITDPDKLRAELAAIRRRGFAVNHGEWRSDVGSVAAVVIGADEKPIASLSVNLPVSRLTQQSEAAFGAAVNAAANNLSARIR